ncbi:MAG: AlkZ family DNA glycosylase [Candidatus Lokiarchaeota archaeon]|nr:AlkZ family DNA glycosylase [Candidatus Lokiarchaeota archaeon]
MSDFEIDQVNSYLLEKHHLKKQSKINNILQIVNDICGLHATGTLEPYLTLFARMNDFKKGDLDIELYKKMSLGRIRGMRKTLFILTKEMIPIVHTMIKYQTVKRDNKYLEFRDISKEQYRGLANDIVNLLTKKELSTSEIKRLINSEKDLNAVISVMCDEMLIIRGKPISSWKDRRLFYAPFSQYFPDIKLDEYDESQATKNLIKKYVRNYGPVTETDIVWWLGITKGKVRASLKQLDDTLETIQIGDLEYEYLLPKSERKSIEDIEFNSQFTVNILPGLDPFIMGYKNRERYVNYANYEYIFDRSGNATTTILLDGYVIGVWDIVEKSELLIKFHLFEKVNPPILDKIEVECKKMGKFITGKEVTIKECNKMKPLNKRTMGGFMTPLKDC